MKDLLNCPNCGAPIEKDYCPYCRSVFLDWASFDVNKPIFVKIKDRFGRIVMMKLAISALMQRIDSYPTYLYSDNNIYYTASSPEYTFEAEFRAVPFHHYLAPNEEIYELLIDPKIADPEMLKDVMKGMREGD